MKSQHLSIALLFLLSILFLALINGNLTFSPKIAIAQTETNIQIKDTLFDSNLQLGSQSIALLGNQFSISDSFTDYFPLKIAENTLNLDGTLDERLYLPFIDNKNVYIFDDFSDPNSGFPIADSSTNTYQYINGEYQILNKTNSYLGAVALQHKLEEFEYEVSMRRVGSARGFYGIIFWLNDTWSEYYLLLISPDTQEHYVYLYRESSGYSQLQNSNCNQINSGNGSNRIRMRQYWAPDPGAGDFREIQLSINELCGVSISFSSQSTETSLQRIGFFAAPIDANHQVHFDDYLYKNYCVIHSGCPN